MMRSFSKILAMGLLSVIPAVATSVHVAVLETMQTTKGLLTYAELQRLTDELRAQALGVLPPEQGFTIMTRENINAMLPPDKVEAACDGTKCLVETGREINAEYIAQGRVSLFDKKYSLSVDLYETTGARLLGTFSGEGSSPSALLAEIKKNAPGLFGRVPGAGRSLLGGSVQAGISGVSAGADYTATFGAKTYIVTFSTEPSGAIVSLDGRPLTSCRETPCKAQVSEGAHRLLLVLDAYDDLDTTVTSSENGQNFSFAMTPNFGTLTLAPQLEDGIGEYKDLRVEIDGNSASTGVVRLSPGEHSVELSHACYEPVNFKVGIVKGGTETFDEKLKPKKGGLELGAVMGEEPQIAPVWVNGVKAGETPWTGTVPVCATVALGEGKQKVDVELKEGAVVKWVEKIQKSQKPQTMLLDQRDGQTYRTVTISGRTWTAENLNYSMEGSYCYGDKKENCRKYGRLYTWKAATEACPAGWHLPDATEWNALAEAVGGIKVAGTALKSRSGWDNDGNGTDDYGFSALPAGYGDFVSFAYVGIYAHFWSATEGGTDIAYYRALSCHHADMDADYYDKNYAFSVRCVQDF
jgi:uncharacterized protein (TIGR02145 family)